jgi:tRNA-splicing ligase RtcB
MRVISETKVPIKIWASDLESEAEQQLRNLATLPFIFKHVAVMPDAHAGKGSTVGTVIATKGAIIPAAVGVDIGCGMCAVKLPFGIDRFERLPELRHSIERSVPVGREGNREISIRVTDFFAKVGTPRAKQYDSQSKLGKAMEQCGSLGGGNHFIEVCRDTEGGAWVVLHSGSRNIGKSLADIHIGEAQGLMKKYLIGLPDPDLAYLAQHTAEFDNYIHDLHWAQNYAKQNREEMMVKILEQVARHVYGEPRPLEPELRVDCHHNYTTMENHYGSNIWVTRKGAVSARAGELGIIPGSMGTRSYIVRGLGNPESFNSCSHGAGRRMSRGKARATFTEADLHEQTMGVECRKDKDVIDEIPGAYKDIDVVMRDQADLVEPVHTLKQVLCVKG